MIDLEVTPYRDEKDSLRAALEEAKAEIYVLKNPPSKSPTKGLVFCQHCKWRPLESEVCVHPSIMSLELSPMSPRPVYERIKNRNKNNDCSLFEYGKLRRFFRWILRRK